MTVFNSTVETAAGVIFQHVCHVPLRSNRSLIKRSDASERFSTENNATDTAKTVDTYFDSHIFTSYLLVNKRLPVKLQNLYAASSGIVSIIAINQLRHNLARLISPSLFLRLETTWGAAPNFKGQPR